MQFLLLCCIDETLWADLTDAKRGQIMEQYGAWIQSLDRGGKHLASAQLDSADRAVTVRHKNGKPAVTDGPFAETKEQLGGYHLVECQDRDEAVALALQIPTLPVGGSIEVRALLRGGA